MATDWTRRLNDTLEALGLYPDVEAHEISDLAGHIVLVDTQEATVYTSAEGCYRLLNTVEEYDDAHDQFDAVGQVLMPNIVPGIRVYHDSGLWRVDHLGTEVARGED